MNTLNLATTENTVTYTYNATAESFFADPVAGDIIYTVIVDADLDADEIDALLNAHLAPTAGHVVVVGGLLTYYGPATDDELAAGVAINAALGNLNATSSA